MTTALIKSRVVAAIEAGKQEHLYLGNLDANRDWGVAGDYVEAMWQMLQHDEPDAFVIATGEAHTVRELCELAFAEAGLDWERYVLVDPRFERPAEVDSLLGDGGKARKVLGWRPTFGFEGLVQRMVDADRDPLARA